MARKHPIFYKFKENCVQCGKVIHYWDNHWFPLDPDNTPGYVCDSCELKNQPIKDEAFIDSLENAMRTIKNLR